MSVTSCDYAGFPFLTNVLSPSLSSADTILIMIWAKLASAGFGTARQIMALGQDNTEGNPHLCVGVSAAHSLQVKLRSGTSVVVNDTTNSSVQSLASDTWTHFAAVMEGPHNGTSKAYRGYVNGTLWDSGTFTSANVTSAYDTVFIGVGMDVEANAADKFAYAAIASVVSLAAAATIIASTQTLVDPQTISGIDHCWSLLSGYGADVGGNTLSNFGTISFDADMPNPPGTAKTGVAVFF